MDYGLGDYTAKPPKEYASSLFDRAIEMGVNTLHTANNYGDSEKVIGEWLKTKGEGERLFVVMKIGPFDHGSPEALKADIIKQTKKSLETFDVDVLDMLMIHSFEDYSENPEVIKATFDEMKKIHDAFGEIYPCIINPGVLFNHT